MPDARCATLLVMGMQVLRIKRVVAALFLAMGFSGSVYAQAAGLDDLYQQLTEAEPAEAERLAGQIIASWERSGSAAMDLLLRRGQEALEDGAPDVAVQHFSALVDHAPEFSEGYYGRAMAYYLLGLTGPALNDIGQVLTMNPRHFEALRGLAIIMEDTGRDDRALEAYRMILDIHPQSPDAQASVSRLGLQLEGQSL